MLKRIWFATSFLALCTLPLLAEAGGVAVGSSSLIGTIDYSDTFLEGTPRGTWPPTVAQPEVENCYENAPLVWVGRPWSINSDSTTINDSAYTPTGVMTYSGTSGAGSDTGITQTGCGSGTWVYGIGYNNLRSDFVVQFDAHASLASSDQIAIMIGSGSTITAEGGATSDGVRYDPADPTGLVINIGEAGISLYNSYFGTMLPPLSVPVGFDVGVWHNYAAHINLDNFALEVFIDEQSCGTVTAAAIGIDPAAISALSATQVSIGYTRESQQPGHTITLAGLQWEDNFQIGSSMSTNIFIGGTSYDTAGNWSFGWVPTSGDQAEIGDNLSATLNTAVSGQPDGLWVGSRGNAGNLDIQNGGVLTLNGAFVVGNNGSSAAALSTLTISGGTLNQTAGQAVVGGDSGAPGKLVISSGALNITTTDTTLSGERNPLLAIGGLGAAGTGSVEQTGGTITIAKDPSISSTTTKITGLNLGNSSGGIGTYTMSGGQLNVGVVSADGVDGNTEMNAFVGANGMGTFTQTGGVVNISRKIVIGNGSAANGSLYDMSTGNGVLNATDLYVGDGTQGSMLIGGDSKVDVAGYIRLARTSGTSTITMDGGELTAGRIYTYQNTAGSGTLDVQGGVVNVKGVYVSGAANVGIYGGDGSTNTTLNLSGGVIDMQGSSIASMAAFNFTGGELRNANVDFSLTQDGGEFNVGYTKTWTGANTSTISIGNTITGDYTLNAGSLLFDIGGTETDKLTVTGAAALNGTIGLSLLPGYTVQAGDSFDLLDFASFTGSPTWELASLGNGLGWDVSNFATNGIVSIKRSSIPGDANNDGRVDGSDVTILAGNWQTLTGANWSMGDFNGDGKVDGSDVTILAGNWQAGVNTSAASVPEPSTVVLLLSVLISLAILRRVKK